MSRIEAPFDFDTVIDRRGTASLKWERYRGTDIIPLWVADMDFRSPPAVIDALRERVEHGIFGYTLPPKELAEEVVDLCAREYGWTIEGEWIVWLPGLVTGLDIACRATGEAGDEVVTLTPIYPPFLSAPHHAGQRTVRVPLAGGEARWEIDFDLLESAVTPRTRLLLLCSPHNPVGRVWRREELQRIADLALRHRLVVCSDEIHAGLILEEGLSHLPLAALAPEIAARTITLHAPSKTYNIPGLGCSFAVIPDQTLRHAFRRAMAGIVPHVNLLGYTAALAAYRHGGDWLRELIVYLRGNRDLVVAEIGRMPGLAATRPEATYLAWIDARETGLDDPARFFEEAGVGLSDGREFGAPGFVRLNFGTSRQLLGEALRRMGEAVSRL